MQNIFIKNIYVFYIWIKTETNNVWKKNKTPVFSLLSYCRNALPPVRNNQSEQKGGALRSVNLNLPWMRKLVSMTTDGGR